MAETSTKKKGTNPLTIMLLASIALLAILGAFFSMRSSDLVKEFLPGGVNYVRGGAAYEVIFILLTVATDVLYLIGGGLVFFGAIIVTIRFIQSKLKDPYQPSGVTRMLSGYLTMSLEFFIGAEIIKTTVTRTYEEFSLLILIIISRGLFSLILYLERRWHGAAETE
jgi:uncharacterized membrane protein